MFGAHYVGDSLKNLRKFLVRAPIGMVIPPSMNAIIGMTTSPVFLSSTHSLWAVYLTPSLGGILYLALNFSIPSLESTRRLNLSIFLRSFEEKLTSLKRKLEGFKETYKFEKKVLRQIFSTYRRTERWKGVTDSMYEL